MWWWQEVEAEEAFVHFAAMTSPQRSSSKSPTQARPGMCISMWIRCPGICRAAHVVCAMRTVWHEVHVCHAPLMSAMHRILCIL